MSTHLDMSKYTRKTGVPILDESTIFYEDDQGRSHPFNVDEAFLNRVATNMNNRERRTGDLSPLVLGKHTDKNANPKDQPPVVGFAHNWRVMLWKDGKKALYADYLINNEDVEEVKRYPRRSAEVWLNRAEIDPISLLGATTPERDLGLVFLNRHPDLKIIHLSREDDSMEPKVEDLNAAASGESGVMKGIEKLVEMMGQVLQAVQGADLAGAGEPSDEEIEKLLQGMSGGGDASAPASGEPVPPAAEPPRKDEPVAQQSSAPPGGNNTEIAKLQRANVELFDRVIRSERKDELAKLQASGHRFDLDSELDFVMGLPNDKRTGYVARLAKNTRGDAPINSGKHPAVANSVTPSRGPVDAETGAKIAKLARDKGLTYLKAAEELGIQL